MAHDNLHKPGEYNPMDPTRWAPTSYKWSLAPNYGLTNV